jgi:isoleucyl-tRNA synthetase
MDRLYRDLTQVTGEDTQSVHLSYFPKAEPSVVDSDLERKMKLAQRISSMILGLRRKVNIRVRQPLQKIMVPVLDERMKTDIEEVAHIILTEVNIKEIEYISGSNDILVKKIKPNFKTLGPRFGKQMKEVAATITAMSQEQINRIEADGNITISDSSNQFTIEIGDVEIMSEDIPGWLVSTEGQLTVALDIQISEELRYEGIARELINRIQNMRKDSGLDVTDKIKLYIRRHDLIDRAVGKHNDYIATQVLANEIVLFDNQEVDKAKDVEIEDDLITKILIEKVN